MMDGMKSIALAINHHQLKHPVKKEKVTVRHPAKGRDTRDLNSI
jgi:predicted RNA binding protein YcfA (HicA-like mRNA interferase family)